MSIHEMRMNSIASIDLNENWIVKGEKAQKKPQWLLARIFYRLYYCITRTHKDEGLFCSFNLIEEMLRQNPALLQNEKFRTPLKRFLGNVKKINHKHRKAEKEAWLAQTLQKIKTIEEKINVPAQSPLVPSQSNALHGQDLIPQPAPTAIQTQPPKTVNEQNGDLSQPAPTVTQQNENSSEPAPTINQQNENPPQPAPTVNQQNENPTQSTQKAPPPADPAQQQNTVATPDSEHKNSYDTSPHTPAVKTIHELIVEGNHEKIVSRYKTIPIDVFEKDPETGLNMVQTAILAKPHPLQTPIIEFLIDKARNKHTEEGDENPVVEALEALVGQFFNNIKEENVHLKGIQRNIELEMNQLDSLNAIQKVAQKFEYMISELCPMSCLPSIELDTTLMAQDGFWHWLADPTKSPNEQPKIYQWLRCPEARQGLIEPDSENFTPIHIALKNMNWTFFAVLLDPILKESVVDWRSPALEKFILFALDVWENDPEFYPDPEDIGILTTLILGIAKQNPEFINDQNMDHHTAQQIYNDKIKSDSIPASLITNVDSLRWDREYERYVAQLRYDFYKNNSETLYTLIAAKAQELEAQLN